MGCPICNLDRYKYVKKSIRNVQSGVEMTTLICVRCAAKLHFGTLVGWESYTPKTFITVEGKKFEVKKGKVL